MFCVALGVLDIPIDTPLERLILPLTSCYRLQINSKVRGGTPRLLSFLSTRNPTALNLCRPVRTATVSESSYVLQSYCVCRTLSPWGHPPPLAPTVFPFLFCMDPCGLKSSTLNFAPLVSGLILFTIGSSHSDGSWTRH